MGNNQHMESPEEYRRRAREHYKAFVATWKLFGKTGFFCLAATASIIALCLAWFANNNSVQIAAGSISGADNELFELAAAGTEANVGKWDDQLPVSAVAGDALTLDENTFLSTGNGKNEIRWAITEDSQMGNLKDSGIGIHPGSTGKITFYIVPKKSGSLTVTLNIALTAQKEKEEDPGLPEDALELLKGHILLFAGYDAETKSYSGWISEDAQTWSMILTDSDGNVTLKRTETGELIWSKEDVVENKAYPVTIYWIWPEVLGEYIFTDIAYTGNLPLLFPEDSSEETVSPKVIPATLFSKMCEVTSGERSNRFFRWANSYDTEGEVITKTREFQDTVTSTVLQDLRGGTFNRITYGLLCDYYNRADQYVGESIRFLNLCVNAH